MIKNGAYIDNNEGDGDTRQKQQSQIIYQQKDNASDLDVGRDEGSEIKINCKIKNNDLRRDLRIFEVV